MLSLDREIARWLLETVGDTQEIPELAQVSDTSQPRRSQDLEEKQELYVQ